MESRNLTAGTLNVAQHLGAGRGLKPDCRIGQDVRLIVAQHLGAGRGLKLAHVHELCGPLIVAQHLGAGRGLKQRVLRRCARLHGSPSI